MKRVLLGLFAWAALSGAAFAQQSPTLGDLTACLYYSVAQTLTDSGGHGTAYSCQLDATGATRVSISGPSGGTTTTTQTKATVAVTNTYIQALASSATRKGCLIQNVGTHTMYVYFGAAPGDTTTSLQLAPNTAISCAAGLIVLTDAVQLTGTAGDVAIVASQ